MPSLGDIHFSKGQIKEADVNGTFVDRSLPWSPADGKCTFCFLKIINTDPYPECNSDQVDVKGNEKIKYYNLQYSSPFHFVISALVDTDLTQKKLR